MRLSRRRRPPRPGAIRELPPLKIASQIALLQLLYYFGAIVLMLFTALVAGVSFGLDLVFGWEAVRGDTTQGWLFGAIAIILLISRSKLVPDFALTLHGLHLVITSLYSSQIPRNVMWWVAMTASSALCIGLGVWGSQWRELRPIFFGGGGGDSGGNRAHEDRIRHENGGPVEDGDPEQGVSSGRGRGRGRDGGGEYEMVGMKGDSAT
ncbi:hypothetical protein ACRALDRAFT_1072270 [Sodiomyces alcalophilus JCM 7366]|uniref:uncharacterized protein n=1 Tax=Sodiomyces alcalophilus JCM 7366 TaxID=591952 RepID=UPI0039B4611D